MAVGRKTAEKRVRRGVAKSTPLSISTSTPKLMKTVASSTDGL